MKRKCFKTGLLWMVVVITVAACGSSAPESDAQEMQTDAGGAQSGQAAMEAPTLEPTQDVGPAARFLNPTSMLETLYPESDGWNWRDSDTSRLSSYYDTENDHILTLIYTDIYFQLGCSASINAWDGEYANSTFTRMLSDFVPADTQSKIMAYFQSQTDLGKTDTVIDGFQVIVTITEEEESRRVYIFVQQQEG